MRTADLPIFEIEQRLFETLTVPSGWFSPRETGVGKFQAQTFTSRLSALNLCEIQIARAAVATTRFCLRYAALFTLSGFA
jgi:hypothetical protein